jgi:hypothetical protein
MHISRRARLLLGATIALGGGGSAAALAAVHAAPATPAAFVALPDAARQAVGVRLQQHDAVAHALGQVLSTASALDIAANRIGHLQADHAGAVRVSFGDFSDDQFYTTLADGSRVYQAQGRPAYVVTYDGVSVPHRGPGTASNHQLNVVVDAASGEVIEVFSFQ